MAMVTIKHLITEAVVEVDETSLHVHERQGWRRIDDPVFQQPGPDTDEPPAEDEVDEADPPAGESAPATKGRKPRT